MPDRAEHRLLGGKVLDHRLDHQVGVVQRAQVMAKGNAPAALRVRLGGQPAGPQLAVVDRSHARFRGRRLVDLDERHLQARLGECRRDARPHRAAADHADAAQRPGHGAWRHARGDPLGTENVAQCARLQAGAQLLVDGGL